MSAPLSLRGEPRSFTFNGLLEAEPCVHSIHHQDCAACVRHLFWYQGRIAGLDEVAGLLGTNAAVRNSLADQLGERAESDVASNG